MSDTSSSPLGGEKDAPESYILDRVFERLVDVEASQRAAIGTRRVLQELVQTTPTAAADALTQDKVSAWL